MKINTFGYYAKEGLKSIVKNRVMSIASISTVGAALFILGIFMVLVANVNNMVGNVTETLELKAFLEDGTSITKRNEIEAEIRKIPSVESVDFETKEEALEKFREQMGENKELTAGLENDNPLPESFIVKVESPQKIMDVSEKVAEIEGIRQVNDGKQYINQIIKIMDAVKYTSLSLMLILGTIAIFLISNTIKLAVYARKREISIMKYIGATDWFIRWPFIIEGVFLGLLGALIAIGVLYGGYNYVANAVSKDVVLITLVPAADIIRSLSLQFILVGMAIGGLGSTISLRKFLVV